MTFHHIKIPGFVLADLYKNDLVLVDKNKNKIDSLISEEIAKKTISEGQETKTPVKSHVQPPSKEWFLGKNLKKITIIVRDDKAIYLQDELLEFLTSILGACKLNLADVAIVNIDRALKDVNQIKKELSPATILMFGVLTNTIGLPFTIPDYKVQNFDACSYLQAPSLDVVMKDKMEKSKLWVCLKDLMKV